jgi:CelD/BcsL family acetyltransferase involved in cellulose biosynthesis
MSVEPGLADRQSASALTVATIVDESAFAALRESWNTLAQSSGANSVFHLHEWFTAAWAWRKQTARLFVLCAYRSGKLSGVLPLIIESDAEGPLHVQRLELLTVPDTQLCDLIAAPEQATEIARLFAAELARNANQWDVMQLHYLSEGTLAGGALLQALAERGFRHERRDAGRNLLIPLDATWAEYYGTRGRSLKKANNLAANRLKKAGEIRVEWIEPGSGETAAVDQALAKVIEISHRSWKKETGRSLDQPGPQAFIRTLTQLAHARGWLSLWLIYINDQALAMEYQLVYAGKVHALRADFDAGCVEISPGSYLFRHLLETMCGRGLKRYYMGPGENAYKTRWSEDGDNMHSVYVYGKSLRGRFAWLNEAVLKPRGRALRDKFSALRRPRADTPTANTKGTSEAAEE